MQRELAPRLRRPRPFGKPVARSIGAPEGFLEHHRLFGSRGKFDLDNELHVFKYKSIGGLYNPKGEALPPRPKGRGFRAEER